MQTEFTEAGRPRGRWRGVVETYREQLRYAEMLRKEHAEAIRLYCRNLRKVATAEERRERRRLAKERKRIEQAQLAGRELKRRTNTRNMTPTERDEHRKRVDRERQRRHRDAEKTTSDPLFGRF